MRNITITAYFIGNEDMDACFLDSIQEIHAGRSGLASENYYVEQMGQAFKLSEIRDLKIIEVHG